MAQGSGTEANPVNSSVSRLHNKTWLKFANIGHHKLVVVPDHLRL